MSIVNPSQLVAEFKKSGEFDRLRRDMLAKFQKSDAMIPLMSRVEDIAHQKMDSDKKLAYMPQEAVHRELMDEMDRYPVVERAVGDFRSRSDVSFSSKVDENLRDILRKDRKEVKPDEANDNRASSSSQPAVEMQQDKQQIDTEQQSTTLPNEHKDVEIPSAEMVVDESVKVVADEADVGPSP